MPWGISADVYRRRLPLRPVALEGQRERVGRVATRTPDGLDRAIHEKARLGVLTQSEERASQPLNAWGVGAGLIVEWADKKGEWYASGEYATELYGDNGWTVREVRKSCRAPEQAGFAVICLALRDVGTAWFDDLEVERVDRARHPG